jgi:hypothetical protein
VSASPARTNGGRDRLVRTLRDRPEPAEALLEVAEKAMRWTEARRSARRLAAAKHLHLSFEMLVVALDALLHGFSREVFDLGQHGGPRGRVRGGLAGGYHLRRYPGVLERGAKG